MSRKIARCRARRDTRIATDSRRPCDSSFNRGRDKVLSLCNIGAENKLLRSPRYRDSSGSIATSKRDSRKGAFIASAESLHYFINPVGIENSSQQRATALSRFSRRLSRMNLPGISTHRMLRRQQCKPPLVLCPSFSRARILLSRGRNREKERERETVLIPPA